ncbi:MAG: hypothetical protein ABI277_03785 [Burkholderiaceae bacterium]
MVLRSTRLILQWSFLTLALTIGARCLADPAPPADCPSPADYAKVAVTDALRTLPDDGPRDGKVVQSARPGDVERKLVGLRDEITVTVSGLEVLLQREACLASGEHRVVLFIDGRPIPGRYPYPLENPAANQLRFELKQEAGARGVWTHLLGSPSFSPRPVKISVGIDNEYAVASNVYVKLNVIPMGWFWTWTLVVLVLLGCFLALAVKSDVIRDPGPLPTSARKPYSLAKTQAAWWFFLIVASYLFIGLVTGDYSTTITGTVLSLMGISAATAVGSATIDAGRAPPVAGTVDPSETKGRWWLDIVSDDDGVNFHRFQMAAWTAVLGVIFIHDVYEGLAMPDFSPTLLGLLGISAGTYLGLKTTSEK